jgi:hypothetical protein
MQLQINNRRKAALIGMFVLGLFTTICSIMRMVQIITIAKTGNSTMLVLWGTIEMNVGVSPVDEFYSILQLFSQFLTTYLQISLTCLPTLTPLFTYFREKSTARYGYSSNNGRSHEHNHSLQILKSQPRSRITETSSDRWKDRDSSDNSSQRGIIGLESSLASHQAPGDKKGITATTRVEVHISDANDGEKERFQRQAKWAGV